MIDIAKVFGVFVLIVFLLRLKLDIGYILILASLTMAILYLMPIETVAHTAWLAVIDPMTYVLFFSLTLIRSFEMLLRENNALNDMTATVKQIFQNKKIVIVSMPILIGMLPSLGGAYFSAPLLEEASKDTGMSAEEKSFINHWFRHVWEPILPLYAGLLLTSGLSKVPLKDIILFNLPCAVLMLAVGFVFSMRDFETKKLQHSKIKTLTTKSMLMSFAPITFLVLIVVVLGMQIHYALIVTVLLLFVFYRSKLIDINRTLKHGFALEILILLFGVMFFKHIMDTSGAIKNISDWFLLNKLPLLPFVILLPFITGLIGGLTLTFVGSSLPLIASLTAKPDPAIISLAYYSGFIGVMLSPVHLCFVLTRQYFKADIEGVYKRLLPATGLLFAGALLQYLIFEALEF